MLGEVRQPSRRLGLQPAAHQVGRVGLGLAHECELLPALERRVVG